MARIDYYELLGVARDVDAAELKRAFRKKAMQYHPDRNPGDAEAEAKFKELNEAYEVLKDPDKRAAYDRYGHAAFDGPGGGAGGFGAGQGHGFDFSDIFEDIFGDFMGGQRGGGRRGGDLRYNLEITLEDAYFGKEVEITVPSMAPCDECGGEGTAPGSSPSTCTTCHGRGKIRAQQGFFTIERSCPVCNGAGMVIEDPCKKCQGRGQVHREKKLSVKIPAGIEDGTRIRLAGEGEPGMRGAPAGDLYIFISVAPHRMFRREGAHIHCRVPIPMTVAALGGPIEVPTLGSGKARIQIPAGTQTGRQIRLKGKGMPVLHGHDHGDMYIEVVVETPVNLTKRQRELLREFGEESGERNNPESTGFFQRVKELWDDLTE